MICFHTFFSLFTAPSATTQSYYFWTKVTKKVKKAKQKLCLFKDESTKSSIVKPTEEKSNTLIGNSMLCTWQQPITPQNERLAIETKEILNSEICEI